MISNLTLDINLIAILLVFLVIFRRRFHAPAKCRLLRDLSGQVIVITGAKTCIGKETAYALARMNATVIIASKDPKKGAHVVKELQQRTDNPKVQYIQLDLADFKSIRLFAKNFKSRYNRLDMLINNATINRPERETTKNGYEAQFGINHLGHFYLTKLLLDVIQRSGPSRIINVSSSAHMDCKDIDWEDIMYGKKYSYLQAYAQSKLANILFTKELQRRVGNKKVKVVALHPGWVRTEFSGHVAKKWYMKIGIKILNLYVHFFGKTQRQGAQTTLYCALEEFEKLEGGMYYSDCKLGKESRLACDPENAKKMWNLSEELITKTYSKKKGR